MTAKPTFTICWFCKECINITGEPGLVYGDVAEAREDFGCQHPLEKVRQWSHGHDVWWTPAEDGDPDE